MFELFRGSLLHTIDRTPRRDVTAAAAIAVRHAAAADAEEETTSDARPPSRAATSPWRAAAMNASRRFVTTFCLFFAGGQAEHHTDSQICYLTWCGDRSSDNSSSSTIATNGRSVGSVRATIALVDACVCQTLALDGI